MKKILLLGTFSFLAFSLVLGADYKVGDKAEDFKLQNVDGKYVSLADFDGAKGYIVVFTCNGCPYAKAYQDRIIALDKKYKANGYPVVAINPNNVDLKSDDSSILSNLGVVLYRTNRLKEAEELLKKALDINSKDGGIYYNLARLYALKGDAGKSVFVLDKAIKLDTSYMIRARYDPEFDEIRDKRFFKKSIRI